MSGGGGGVGGEGCGWGVFGWRLEELGGKINSITSHTKVYYSCQ